MAGVFGSAPHGWADEVSSKRREATKLAAAIDAMGDKLSALAEDENDAKLRLEKLQVRLQKAEAELATANTRANAVAQRARASALRALTEPFGETGALLDSAESLDVLERGAVYERSARDEDRNTLDLLSATQEDLMMKRLVVERAKTETESLQSLLVKRKANADALLKKYEVLEKRAQGQLKVLVQEAEEARIAAEAKRVKAALAAKQAAARKELTAKAAKAAKDAAATQKNALKKKAEAEKRLAELRRKGNTASAGDIAKAQRAAESARASAAEANASALADRSVARDISDLRVEAGQSASIPASPGGNTAVQVALAQLGKPYIWGASGPNGFDCSGLMLTGWKAAGKSLPHSSRAQYAATTRVSVNQIRPGDLVFYGSPIHHVGMYIGNGQMVEASRRGVPVRTRSIFRKDMVGVGRVG
jgi:peptidoglycan DL-endopeptidase CwlO